MEGTPKASRTRLHPFESFHQHHTYAIDHDITPEAIEDPAFWSNVAALLRPWDRITVEQEEGAWIAECVIQDVGSNYAKVKILQKFDLCAKDAIPADVPDSGFKIEWAGIHHRFRVKRVKDGQIVMKDFASREAAHEWLLNHLKAYPKAV